MTSNLLIFFLIDKIFSISSPVVRGTVDFVTIILYLFKFSFMVLATSNTYLRLASLFFLVGVPTQINMISDFFIEFGRSFENLRLFDLKFFLTIYSNPGS